MGWPTTNDPREVFVTLRLTKSEAADLDAYRAARNLNRSAAVRDATSRVIAAEKKRAARQRPISTAKPSGRLREDDDD